MNNFFTGVFKYLEFPNALGVMNSFLARATVGTSLYVSLRVSSSVPFCFLSTSRDVVRHRTV